MVNEAPEIKVRVATPEDVHEVMDMAFESIQETGIAEANPEIVLAEIWPALNRYCGIVGIIGKPGEKAEGCVVMGLSGIWYSNIQFLEERFIYVRPEFRFEQGGRANKLCEFSKNVANGLEMSLVMGTSTRKKQKGKRRLYQRNFGAQVGEYYLYTHSKPEQPIVSVSETSVSVSIVK